MKHTSGITLLLLALFFAAQVMGLLVTSHYLGVTSLPMDIQRPEMDQTTAFIPIIILVIVATFIALLLFRFRMFKVWRIWYMFSVWFTLTISFTVFIRENIAMAIAAVFALVKTFKPNVIVHNFTEIFIYGALAALFVPILNLFSVSILLIAISIYDYIAVRKTGHMVTLAKTQSEVKVFSGLSIPYQNTMAILGGGDIGFALLFAGVVMKTFAFKWYSLGALIVPICTAGALSYLLYTGSKKKFYPAMPYISVGAFAGLIIVSLLDFLL